jgi:HEAT repeat protein
MTRTRRGDLAQQFDVFRDSPYDLGRCRSAVQAIASDADHAQVVASAQEFVRTERYDEVRAWGINVLELVPDASSFDFLMGFIKAGRDAGRRRRAKYSRLYSLKALDALADSDEQRDKLDKLIEARWSDDAEDALPRAYAAVLGVKRNRREARVQLETMFEGGGDSFWLPFMVLRALRECPVPVAAAFLLERARDKGGYVEIRHRAIEQLAAYEPTSEIVRAVGEVLAGDENEYLRLSAAVTLGLLGDHGARQDLISGVADSNAEVRVQATRALEKCVGRDDAVTILVASALTGEDGRAPIGPFVDALRLLDADRTRSTAALSKELGSEDRSRAQRAESILLELGGWSAVQRLSQRRATLEQLDSLLEESEAVVQRTFEATVKQAQRNFYFALVVNALVVAIGVALSVIAIIHLVQTPEDLQAWLLPGAGGVIGLLINLTFNNPRNNARDDLATLVNVNVLFLGFLRQLNEIDATFKHAYIEGGDFGVKDMKETVGRIDATVASTLGMTTEYLRVGASTNGSEAEAGQERVATAR